MSATVLHGDCRDKLPTIADGSITAIVTDPPYELGFMGKKWDSTGIAYDINVWRECLRVLKPGGHLLAFGGTRTYHRMVVAIEDAGFEIRDSIHWLYGSGFPKSLDVSKAIDKAAGHWRGRAGVKMTANGAMSGANYERNDKGDAITPAAAAAAGWGTALKPAHEPLVLARKPITTTVAANVLEHGTGALNIDGCRVETTDRFGGGTKASGGFVNGYKNGDGWTPGNPAGRWPANIVFTHAADCGDTCAPGCAVAELDAQSGKVGAAAPASGPTYSGPSKSGSMAGAFAGNGDKPPVFHSDQGGASRFFPCFEWDDLDTAPFRYVAKPGKKERNAGLDEAPVVRHADRVADDKPGGDNPRNRSNTARQNFHPTVKPIALMRWLVRLITPPGGTVLDPFLGSGTTAVAAILEGFPVIGIEMTDDYLPIIKHRIAWATEQAVQPTQLHFASFEEHKP